MPPIFSENRQPRSGVPIVEEPARLVCPQCDLVYRLKKFTPGRAYACKSCGTPLRRADAAMAGELTNSEAGAIRSARAAFAAAGQADKPPGDLARLPKLIEKLTAHLDAIKGMDLEPPSDSPVDKLIESLARLEHEVRQTHGELGVRIRDLDEKVADALDEKLRQIADGMAERLSVLDEKIAAVSQKPEVDPAELATLRSAVETGQAELVRRLEEHHAAQKMEINALLSASDDPGKTTVEVDIDELADRLVAGVRGRGPMYDAETGSAVDALAKLADQLVKEQNSNTTRLDKLAVEIHDAIANIAKLEEWQGELPDRVADEIGATVEARVVGPISGALARQAPSILSELQDSKLVDIVSRSVREAQRPLLREILAGGRHGVPVWLFASVLLPLLLILGYLFLPGEVGGYGATGVSAEVSDAIARIETSGVPLTPDAEDRLHSIEEAVLDIHNQALSHVKNAAALEEEVKNLRRRLEERDKIISDYTTTLERQTKRLQAYEFRLVQLGVKPDAVAGQ